MQTPTLQRRTLLGPAMDSGQGAGNQPKPAPNRFAAGMRAFSISGGVGLNKLADLKLDKLKFL